MQAPKIRRVDGLDGLELLQAGFDQHRFVAHCHPTFVIQRVDAGADWCALQGKTAGRGDVWVHLPGAVHTGGTVRGSELRYSAIYPTRRLAAELLGTSVPEVPTGSSFVISDSSCARLLSRMFSRDDLPESQLTECVRELLFRVTDHAGRVMARGAQDCTPSIPAAVQALREHLMRHCDRKVSTAELCGVSGLSASHLIREFKRWVGITPRQFLICQRVARAKEILSDGLPLLDAALASGFADQSHMNRCFRRIAGYSPGNFVA